MTEPITAPDAYASYLRAKAAPQQMESAQQQLRRTGERRFAEEAALVDLYQRLDHITGWHLATWWPRLTGQIRGRQSEVTTEIVRQTEVRNRAVAEHEAAIQQMRDVQHQIDGLPAARDAAVQAMTGPGAAEGAEVLGEVNKLQRMLVRIARAQSLAGDATASLDTAGRWSTYDTYLGGGIGASAVKHDYIDTANQTGVALMEELTSLRSELQDMKVPTAFFSIQDNDPVASSDTWWDNVISDIAMQRRIVEGQDRLGRLTAGLRELSTSLGERHRAAVDRLDALMAAEHSAES